MTMNAPLPYAEADEADFATPGRVWDASVVNYAAVECWKEHRAKGKQREGDLSLLAQANIDIVFEVLSHLHPLDLIHVSRTNKAFRDLLLCPNADALWRNAFAANPPLPSCPAQTSGRRWTRLLFGQLICDECKCLSPDTKADYVLCRRLCDACLDEPVENEEPLAALAVQWVDGQLERSQRARQIQHQRVIRKARKHLVLEGYNLRDLCDLDEYSELESIQVLTPKRWHLVRPFILPRIEILQSERIARERAELISKRTEVGIKAASWVLRTAPAQCWPYFPPGYTLETFPALKALIHDPSDDPLLEDDPRLSDALLGLPAFVAAWTKEKQVLLTSVLPQPAAPNALELATSVFMCKGSWVNRTAVTAGRVLIGWAGAGAHLRCRSLKKFWDHRVHYAPEGAAAARQLVRLVGFDPERATFREMDELCGDGRVPLKHEEKPSERRFVCGLCPVVTAKGMTGRPAMRWRECVLHTIEQTRLHKTTTHIDIPPAFMLLTDAATADVLRREKPDPFICDNSWVCALCTEHYDNRERRQAVLNHIWTTHGIREPTQGTHFLYVPGTERTPRPCALVSQLPSDSAEEEAKTLQTHVDIRCRHCTTPRKLFSLRTIARHVADKHGVCRPTEAGVDWERVELVVRDALAEEEDESGGAAAVVEG
ncbi:hypothetical protein HMN09_01207000 [Mycena chlorophos]|uniref:F-box domain-containing protein n=1 Tax=Mycena chlorophos TaxID=658473 RepID=A0A8H6VVB8_MYCCL|nr:hypothetical protein HMN09_01207000 [Mycena chlorophos]